MNRKHKIREFKAGDEGREIEFVTIEGAELGKLKSFDNERSVAFVTFGLPLGKKEVTMGVNYRDLRWPRK